MENNKYKPNPNYQTGENQNQGFGSSQQQQYNQQPYNQQQQAPNGNFQNNQGGFLAKVPNSGGVLALGILSILSICCCGPFLGPILAIITIIMASKGKKAYMANPNMYSTSSFSSLKAGQICAFIGLGLGIIFAIYFAFTAIMNPNNMNELNEVFGNAWNEMNY